MEMIDPFRVFVGYDSREPEQYAVACASLKKVSSVPVCIQPLDIRALAAMGLFRRRQFTEDHQIHDILDDGPATTEFTYTRYLVPALCQWKGWALFVDPDFLFRHDPARLFTETIKTNSHLAAMVVQHAHASEETTKMRGQLQTKYHRKNWASFVLFNCGHVNNRLLTPYRVCVSNKKWLHGFGWLKDQEIGELSVRWNWLEGISDPDYDPGAVHYTRGTPNMPGYENAAYADEWRSYL